MENHLSNFPIKNPCPKNWEGMKGNSKQRFCGHCNLHVHNLSAMSETEINVLTKTPGRLCVTYLANKETPIIRSGLPTFLKSAFPRIRYTIASVLALIFPLAFTSCKNQVVGEITPSNPAITNSQRIMGDVAVEPARMLGEVECVSTNQVQEQILGKTSIETPKE